METQLTTDSLAQRINAKAAARLKLQIDGIANSIVSLMEEVGVSVYDTRVASIREQSIQCRFWDLLDVLKGWAFDATVDRYKARAVTEFLAKVETLHREIE